MLVRILSIVYCLLSVVCCLLCIAERERVGVFCARGGCINGRLGRSNDGWMDGWTALVEPGGHDGLNTRFRWLRGYDGRDAFDAQNTAFESHCAGRHVPRPEREVVTALMHPVVAAG